MGKYLKVANETYPISSTESEINFQASKYDDGMAQIQQFISQCVALDSGGSLSGEKIPQTITAYLDRRRKKDSFKSDPGTQLLDLMDQETINNYFNKISRIKVLLPDHVDSPQKLHLETLNEKLSTCFQ